jgi:multisubunit Na+/H+ antiporter MnhG subunit
MLKAAGIGGSILVLIALAIALLTKLIAFIGFITWAVKILIVVVFVVVIAAVGFMLLKSWQAKRNPVD